MNIFVTGATGSLGRALIRALTAHNQAIRISIFSEKGADLAALKSINDSIEIYFGDLLNVDSIAVSDELRKHLYNIDIFIHCAALVHSPKAHPHSYEKVNYVATKVLAALFLSCSQSKIKQFIFISSVSVYGNHKDTVYVETDECKPLTPYAITKLKAELAISEICQGSLPFTILRLATLYGPNDRGNINMMLNFIRKYHLFPVFGDGQNKKCFVAVTDAAKAIVACINNPSAYNQTFNISAPEITIQAMHKIFKSNGLIYILFRIPMSFFQKISAIKQLLTNNIYDYHKAENLLGYTPLAFQEGSAGLFALSTKKD